MVGAPYSQYSKGTYILSSTKAYGTGLALKNIGLVTEGTGIFTSTCFILPGSESKTSEYFSDTPFIFKQTILG